MNPSLVVTFLSVVSYSFGAGNCPDYSRIGCQCGNSSSITCRNWDHMDRVADYMDRVAELRLMTFILQEAFLPALPAQLFRNTAFSNIRFHRVSLPFLGPPLGGPSPFSGLEDSLQEFHLQQVSYLYNWDWSLLSRLANLIKLKVTQSKVLRIRRDFSSVTTSLRSIEMVECGIKWIDDGAFASLVSLGDILLNKNNIWSFKRSYLPDPAEELTVINLSGNSLTELEEDLFARMPQLKIVSLEQNSLTTIPATVAERMSIFNGFRINDNPLICHCHLIKLCRGRVQVDSYDDTELPTCTAAPWPKPLTICHQQVQQLLQCR